MTYLLHLKSYTHLKRYTKTFRWAGWKFATVWPIFWFLFLVWDSTIIIIRILLRITVIDFDNSFICSERNNEWALKQAKANVLKWYSTIGVLDCIEETISNLEKTFPHFFDGASYMYKKVRKYIKLIAASSLANIKK